MVRSIMFPNYKRHLPRSYIMGTLIRRREDPEYATEMLNEVGTTDEATGDVTAEIMITTPGKIPDEMYELDETTVNGITLAEEVNTEPEVIEHEKVTSGDGVSGFAAHSTLFIVLLVALLLLIVVCCISACVIARARKKHQSSSDMECDADCRGAKQPLINSDKMSETTTKSSAVSTRH